MGPSAEQGIAPVPKKGRTTPIVYLQFTTWLPIFQVFPQIIYRFPISLLPCLNHVVPFVNGHKIISPFHIVN